MKTLRDLLDGVDKRPLKQLFKEIINERGIYKKLNMNDNTVKALRRYLKKDKVSVEKMREICAKMGYQKVQEELWQKK